jgi:hypothetical protein
MQNMEKKVNEWMRKANVQKTVPQTVPQTIIC